VLEYGHDCQFARTLKRRGRKVPRTQPRLDDNDDETPLVPVQPGSAGSVIDQQTSEDGHPPASLNGHHRLIQHHNSVDLSYPLPDGTLDEITSEPWASLEYGASVRAHRDREPRISFETPVQQPFSSPGTDRHECGSTHQQHPSVGGSVIAYSDKAHFQSTKEPEQLSRALPSTGHIAGSTVDPKYACLKSILPLIKDIIHPETALKLLHA